MAAFKSGSSLQRNVVCIYQWDFELVIQLQFAKMPESTTWYIENIDIHVCILHVHVCVCTTKYAYLSSKKKQRLASMNTLSL